MAYFGKKTKGTRRMSATRPTTPSESPVLAVRIALDVKNLRKEVIIVSKDRESLLIDTDGDLIIEDEGFTWEDSLDDGGYSHHEEGSRDIVKPTYKLIEDWYLTPRKIKEVWNKLKV